ncbi:hypothetical protein MnTg03_00694 [bacterium MnTg03]|nr:hypothetical protein MnTg03_00694 [bacterium MnTg03]
MAINKSLAATIGEYHAANNTFVVARHFVILQPFSCLHMITQIESNTDFCLLFVCLDAIAIGPITSNQFDRIKQNRFSSTGFSSQCG